MVGDHPVADIAGAQRLGFGTIWVQRERAWPNTLTPPDAMVDSAVGAIQLLLNG